MSNFHRLRQQDAVESARQRGLAAQRFSTPLSRDLFAIVGDAGLALAEEVRRNRSSAEVDELKTEGRVHVNTRPDRDGP